LVVHGVTAESLASSISDKTHQPPRQIAQAVLKNLAGFAETEEVERLLASVLNSLDNKNGQSLVSCIFSIDTTREVYQAYSSLQKVAV